MKKSIAIALALCCGISTIPHCSAQISGVDVEGGILDRTFDTERTLYYVSQTGDNTPEVSCVGGTVLKNGNVTVVQDDETGKKYRFVLDIPDNETVISNFNYNPDSGILEILGTEKNNSSLQIIITKPKDDEGAYSLPEIDFSEGEAAILDIEQIPGGNINYLYTFGQDCEPGYYRIVICAEESEGPVFEREVYFASATAKTECSNYINSFEYTQAMTEAEKASKRTEILNYIEANRGILNLDLTNYNKILDKSSVADRIIEGSYSALDDIRHDFDEIVVLSLLGESNDPTKTEELLQSYSSYFSIDYTTLDKVNNKAAAYAMLNGKYTETTVFESSFLAASATQYINESTAKDLPARLAEVRQDLGISDDLWAKFSALSDNSNAYLAIRNKGFTSPVALVTAFESGINTPISKPPVQSSGGGGAGGGGGGGGISATAPSTPSTYAPDNEMPVTKVEGFTDIESVPWAKEQILYLHDMDIISGKGDGIFAPHDTLTREEYVKMLVDAFMLTGESNTGFLDVDKNAWYYKYISAAHANHIISGISEEEFGVGKPITRQDMCVILHRVLEETGVKLPATDKYYNMMTFEDNTEIDEYAYSSVEKMFKNGIISGISESLFSPKTNATRAQAAVIVYRALLF